MLMLIEVDMPFGIPTVLWEFLCGKPAAATRGIIATDLGLYKTGIVDRLIGPLEGGVDEPALGRSSFGPLDVPDDETEGVDELNDFGSGKAEGRTVWTDIIFVLADAKWKQFIWHEPG